MATPSSLVSSIDSFLQSLGSEDDFSYRHSTAPPLVRGLKNLKLLLVCLGDDHVRVRRTLFSMIEAEVARISKRDHAVDVIENYRSERKVSGFSRHVNRIWYTKGITMPNHLRLDDAVQVADSVLGTTADYLVRCWKPATPLDVGAVDEFKAQTGFLRDFLLFAKRSGVDSQNLLIQVSPFVLDAARLFQARGTFSFGDEEWVEAVESGYPRVDPQVFQAYIQTLISIPMSTLDADVLKDFIGSLVSLLWHLLRYGRHPRHLDSLKALYEALRLSRSYLKQNNNGGGRLEDPIGVLIRDAGIVIRSLYLTDVHPPDLSILLPRFDTVQAQVPPESNSIKASALDFSDGDSTGMEDTPDGKVQTTETSTPHHQGSTSPGEVGFQEDEVASILDRLTRGSKRLRLVPISGMAGLGKTTFALKVYNHPSVIYHFKARAWCTISQVLDRKRVLVQLLDQIQPGNYSGMTEDDLANKLRQSLKGKRYLILIDDVWTPQVWEKLSLSFPNDATQSRIVLTSRLHAIVPDEQPHFLRLRKENECLEIIEMKLLHKAKGSRAELGKFANLCKGLPLTSVLVAGLLSTTVQQGWDDILDHLSSGGISGIEQCKIALELSYKNLPNDLKCCFIYFGVFPEDEEIYVNKLIRLWMAEGFVDKKNNLSTKRIEDVAQEYLDNLIQRNLVMVAEKKSIGGIKTCRIHDLLHDFCLIKGKQENLFHLLRQRDDELSDFNEPYNLERMSIHSNALHFWESRLFCPLAHSILFFDSTMLYADKPSFDLLFIINIYKGLKVLDMHQIRFARGIPGEIAFLTQLTYLSVGLEIDVIPSSIGNLSNLETLILDFLMTETVTFPHTFWDLQKLKYVHITGELSFNGFHLATEGLEKCPNLLDLETICGVEFYPDGSMEKQMSKFSKIRKLKCKLMHCGESSEKSNKIVVVPEFLIQLECLTLYTDDVLIYQFDFLTSKSLKKVTLCGFVLSRKEIAEIGKLPNLEFLKLSYTFFSEGKMEMGDGEFSKLRILYPCEIIKLKTWTAIGDDQLPCLEKLLIHGCRNLKEIPDSCLEYSTTLEEIEVSYSSFTLERIVKRVEKAQKDFGNSIKVKFDSNQEEEEEEEDYDDDDDDEEEEEEE